MEIAYVTAQRNEIKNQSVIGIKLHDPRPLTEAQTDAVAQKLAKALKRVDTLIKFDYVKNSILICIQLLGVLRDHSLRRIMQKVKWVLETLGMVERAEVYGPFNPVH